MARGLLLGGSMTFGNGLRRFFLVAAALTSLAGCGDDGTDDGTAGAAGQAGAGGAIAGSGGTGNDGGTAHGGAGEGGDGDSGGAGEGAGAGAGGQAGSGASDCIAADAPFEWPVPLEDVSVPAHASWKTELALPDEPFLSVPDNFSPDAIRWVKFVVLLSEPDTVYFQDSNVYSFHYEFATQRIPEFEGMTRQEFDAVTLSTEGQRAILGAVLVPGDPLRYPEYAVQLVVNDAMHPELARTIVESVRESIQVSEPRRTLYFPNPAQMLCAAEHEAYFAEHELPIGSVDSWLVGDACYAPGWAIGRLVQLAAREVPAAYLDGTLKPEDILLLTDPAPAELPFVAGVLTLEPSTPNSHSAILARSYGVPFAYLRREEAASRAEELVGKHVVVSTQVSLSSGDCAVRFIDVETLTAAERAEIEQLAVPPPIEIAPKRATGDFTLSTEGLVPSDIDRVGGKAAHFGVVAAGSPDFVPSPSFAITFDAWDAFMDQPAPDGAPGSLRDEIARRLEPFGWPADLGALGAALEGVVDLIRDAPLPVDVQDAVQEALEPFDPMTRIRFRSSTNVEDSETFTGAGLYDSVTGCLADDQDEDSSGPSLCNPEETGERGVFRAIKRVYSSFYAQNAYFQRLRRGVNEEDVGMGVLVHYSVPDPTELANGVATLTVESPEARKVDLVTQLGAVSVTNPEGSARPETVRIERYDTSSFLQTVEWS
ncbi:MAG TPA: PEP/pyruvate-binding domain-containing protein, partial [Polyangiaceae bacterium]